MDSDTFFALKRVIKNGRWNELEMNEDLSRVEIWLDQHIAEHNEVILKETKSQ